jgi:beta-glucanase (GH16 family)
MNRLRTIAYSLALIAIIASCSNNSDAEYKLVFADEFEYTGLPDTTKWLYDTIGNSSSWGNNELQHYTCQRIENTSVNNGVLSITAHNGHLGGKDYSSARLMSNIAIQYGKVEVSAKLPDGRGTWPAIWMMPGGWSFPDGNWPDVGEIDIMEHVGYEPGVVHASAHSKDYQWQAGTQKTGILNVPNATTDFNKYILEWTPNEIQMYVNDSLYFVYENEGLGETKWPYDKPFYLLLNVAVGGAWGNVMGIDAEAFPQTMEVDYVRIYQLEE